jgi:hypothetical protein
MGYYGRPFDARTAKTGGLLLEPAFSPVQPPLSTTLAIKLRQQLSAYEVVSGVPLLRNILMLNLSPDRCLLSKPRRCALLPLQR